jgi:two-component system NtrC family sensor kinase
VLGHVTTVDKSLASVRKSLGPEIGDAEPALERAVSRAREARRGLERIQTLVHQLRTFSRLDEGDLKRVSVRDSVESVLAILRHRIGVGNAIDAIDGEGTVTIATRARDGCFELTVTDTGRGIPESVRDRVFEPFFTTKPVGAGTGLGLSITYSIAQKHGGTVELCPGNGGGTVARLRWPLDRIGA